MKAVPVIIGPSFPRKLWADFLFFFFFSSRRRHTRYIGDWSSDVCSSDLLLVNQAGGSLGVLRSKVERLDKALAGRNQPESLREIRDVVAACEQSSPELLARLKQHISLRGMLAGIKKHKVTQALGGSPIRNAYFWRLLARAFEESKPEPEVTFHTCSLWEEFRRHAVHEKWFPEHGPEVAALYLHMADLLRRVHEEDAG